MGPRDFGERLFRFERGPRDGWRTNSQSKALLGAACTPSPVLSPSFAGFHVNGITLDVANADCGGATCLVSHFQGLPSCPYGQDRNGDAPPGATACTVAGTSTPVGLDGGDRSVPSQCTDRSVGRTVYCSCRCANAEGSTDDGATYCACPSDYTCSQVARPVAAGDPRAGAYCVKNGTLFDRANSYCPSCIRGVNLCL